jgi:hypothetical protein
MFHLEADWSIWGTRVYFYGPKNSKVEMKLITVFLNIPAGKSYHFADRKNKMASSEEQQQKSGLQW